MDNRIEGILEKFGNQVKDICNDSDVTIPMAVALAINAKQDAAQQIDQLYQKVLVNVNACYSYVNCPFCGENDFDQIGLKYHLTNYCETYQGTEVLPL